MDWRRALNRWRLLWGYLRGHACLRALPVEYIVETTTRCNLHCPMCPRQIYPQPNQDMPEEIFRRLVAEAAPTAEHMMLVGLGEPLLDRRIFERIAHCARHGIATLLSTNGTLLDEKMAARLLASPLEHLTLSFDGATAATFEFHRRGARFEQVRENFLRLCRMKQQQRSGIQIVVQLVRLESNAAEVAEFIRFWSRVPGVDLVRIKEDETRLLGGKLASGSRRSNYPCHYLWRGPLYVRYDGEVFPCCQSYLLGGRPLGRLDEESLAALWNSQAMQRLRRLHAEGRGGEVEMCSRCCATLPHPVLAAGSFVLHGRLVRRWLPRVEKLAGRWLQAPAALTEAAPQPSEQETLARRG